MSLSNAQHPTPNTQRPFFVAGGTLQSDAPCYVTRQADSDLLEGLIAGQFCYVLTSRQMGKSSLMVRTAERLKAEGVSVAVLDLTAIGQNLSPQQWYDGLLSRVGQQLDLEDELDDFWLEHERLGPLQRWMRAIREVVLEKVPGQVVLFVDEIDAVRSLPFSTDEFFAAIRECYNRRTADPEMTRLTFCLLGVATPSDLIQDVRTTPFNIGRRIELTDFTEREAAPLGVGCRVLGVGEKEAQRLIERVLYWTGGHPYMTQQLCQAVVMTVSASSTHEHLNTRIPEHPTPNTQHPTPALVDRLCEELFLSQKARETNPNLTFVQQRMLKSEAVQQEENLASLLDLYQQALTGKRVRDDEASPLVSVLRLSGITRPVGGELQVRNRIYAQVFDKAWVTANMPDAELRRQRRAYLQGLARSAAIFGLIGLVIVALVFKAFSEARRADANASRADANAKRADKKAGEAQEQTRLYQEASRQAQANALEAKRKAHEAAQSAQEAQKKAKEAKDKAEIARLAEIKAKEAASARLTALTEKSQESERAKRLAVAAQKAKAEADQSARAAKAAETLAQQEKDRANNALQDVSDTLRNLGDAYAGQNQFDKALDSYDRAVNTISVLGDEMKTAVCRSKRGAAYEKLEQFDRAKADYMYFLTIMKNKQKDSDPANLPVLQNLSNICEKLGQMQEAQMYRARAEDLKKTAIKNSVLPFAEDEDIHRLRDEGQQAINRNDLPAALTAYQAGLERAQNLQDDHAITLFLNNLGNAYARLNQFEKASTYFQRSLILKQKQGNGPDIASGLYNLGNVYNNLGQFDKAIDYHTRALTLQEKLGNEQNIAYSLTALGLVYNNLGQFRKAIDYHTRALALREKLGDAQGATVSFNNLGVVYFNLGQFEKAKDYHLRAMTIREKLGNEQDIAQSLDNLGRVYRNLNQLDKALDNHTRALALEEKLGDSQKVASSLHNLGEVYVGQGQFAKALVYFQRALTIQVTIGNPLDTAVSLHSLGAVYANLGRLEESEHAYRRALALFEAGSAQLGSPDQRGAFQQTFATLYPRYAHLLLRRKRSAEAMAMVERGRGRALAAQRAWNRLEITRLLTPTDAAEFKQHTDALTTANSLLLAVQGQRVPATQEAQPAFARQLEAARTNWETAERQLSRFRDSLLARYPQYSHVQNVAPPKPTELLALARRNPDTLYLEYAPVDDKTTLLFALSHQGGIKTFLLPIGGKTLSGMVDSWRKMIRALEAAEAAQARQLYATLLGPVEKAGLMQRSRRLVFVADGALVDLPFAALLDDKGKRLLERFALSSTVSLGFLTWPRNRATPSASLFGVADTINLGNVLPAARREGREIAALFAQSKLFVASRAREADVKREMGRYALLHFATNGIVDTQSGLRSGLGMAPEPAGSTEDGILEAREVAEMRLRARLVVLSTVDTARGQSLAGEGALGLSWAFLAAGAESVVGSLGNVEDEATYRLMVAFYKALKAGKRKDEALREAMLLVKKQKPQPYYWAAFQVIGNTDPLPANLTAK